MNIASQTPDGKAVTVATTFSRATSVAISIRATPEIIWALLTQAGDFPRWNSTVKNIDGVIATGKKIHLKTTVDEKRIFTLKVTTMKPHTHMTWQSGQAPFFTGVRDYVLEAGRGTTVFRMTEKLSGLMFPLAASSIPDFREMFVTYAADLKKEAETIMNVKA